MNILSLEKLKIPQDIQEKYNVYINNFLKNKIQHILYFERMLEILTDDYEIDFYTCIKYDCDKPAFLFNNVSFRLCKKHIIGQIKPDMGKPVNNIFTIIDQKYKTDIDELNPEIAKNKFRPYNKKLDDTLLAKIYYFEEILTNIISYYGEFDSKTASMNTEKVITDNYLINMQNKQLSTPEQEATIKGVSKYLYVKYLQYCYNFGLLYDAIINEEKRKHIESYMLNYGFDTMKISKDLDKNVNYECKENDLGKEITKLCQVNVFNLPCITIIDNGEKKEVCLLLKERLLTYYDRNNKTADESFFMILYDTDNQHYYLAYKHPPKQNKVAMKYDSDLYKHNYYPKFNVYIYHANHFIERNYKQLSNIPQHPILNLHNLIDKCFSKIYKTKSKKRKRKNNGPAEIEDFVKEKEKLRNKGIRHVYFWLPEYFDWKCIILFYSIYPLIWKIKKKLKVDIYQFKLSMYNVFISDYNNNNENDILFYGLEYLERTPKQDDDYFFVLNNYLFDDDIEILYTMGDEYKERVVRYFKRFYEFFREENENLINLV